MTFIPGLRSFAFGILASSLIGGSAGVALAQAPTPNQTLVVLENYDATTLDPAIAYDPPSVQATSLAYESLLTLKGSTTALAPGLAVQWHESDQGKVWTLALRHGVQFADGTAFTSAAVKFSLERLIHMNQGPAWMFDVISQIAIPSRYTVVITLKYPYQPFIYTLAQPAGGLIVSPAGVIKHGNAWFQNHTDGTGPYQVQTWIHGNEIVLTKNPDYWQGWGGHHVDQVILKISTEPSTEQMLLQSGQADMNNAFPLSNAAQLQGQPGLAVHVEPGPSLLYIGLNNRQGPTSNVLVRRALSYAMDYRGAVRTIYNGFAQQAQGPVPNVIWGHDSSLFQYHYDLKMARSLLTQAGYPHGFHLTITCEENPLYEQVVQSFSSSLAQIGVDATVKVLPWAVEYEALVNPKTAPGAFITSWYGDFADPDGYLYPLFDSAAQGSVGFNLEWYGNPKVDALLSQARTQPNHTSRVRLYTEVQRLLVKDAPVIWVLNQKTAVVTRSDVHGDVFNPLWPVNVYAISKQ